MKPLLLRRLASANELSSFIKALFYSLTRHIESTNGAGRQELTGQDLTINGVLTQISGCRQ